MKTFVQWHHDIVSVRWRELRTAAEDRTLMRDDRSCRGAARCSPRVPR